MYILLLLLFIHFLVHLSIIYFYTYLLASCVLCNIKSPKPKMMFYCSVIVTIIFKIIVPQQHYDSVD